MRILILIAIAVTVAAVAVVGVVAWSTGPHTISCSWEALSLSNFLAGELEGDWCGGDERSTILFHFEKARSRVALSAKGHVEVLWVELGTARLAGIDLRCLTAGKPTVQCVAEIQAGAGPVFLNAIEPGEGWPHCPVALVRPGEADATELREAIRRSLEPGAPALVWREVAEGTYQRGMMGPDLVFAAFPDDNVVREPMREEANLRATVWTLEDQRANRAPWK